MDKTLNTIKRYNNSRAEQRFYEYVSKKYPNLKITKKGLPDFMLIKNKKVIGFVEVKGSDLSDDLTKEQRMFKNFCKEKEIPYQVWSPMMTSERWKKSSLFFKKRMMYANNSIFKQLNE
ncbi:MAG: VRR-NUC domain-containing protein [Candidatus Nealsonbacteria bacterium]